MPISGATGSFGDSVYNILRMCHTVFHSSCTFLHSHHQCSKFQFLYILANICCCFFLFFLLVILMSMKCQANFLIFLGASLWKVSYVVNLDTLKRDLLDEIFYLEIAKKYFPILLIFSWQFPRGPKQPWSSYSDWMLEIKVADTDYGDKIQFNIR